MDALHTANEGFERRLRLVRADDWQAPTPCTEWDQLAHDNHDIRATLRYTMLLHGASASDVDATRGTDHVGSDAVTSFATTAREIENAFGEPGALDRVATHPVGIRTGSELLSMRILDVTIHTWDLARAIRAGDDLGADLVEFALAFAIESDFSGSRGAFAAPQGELALGSAAQTKLLHLVGRQPTQ
jgi:uncharacterized protein (TIGR03086 family)